MAQTRPDTTPGPHTAARAGREATGFFTIRMRLVAVGLALPGLLIAGVLGGWAHLTRLEAEKAVEVGIGAAVSELHAVMRGLDEFVITEGADSARRLTLSAAERFSSSFGAVLARTRDARLLAALKNNVRPEWEAFSARLRPLLALPKLLRDDSESLAAFRAALRTAEAAAEALEAARDDLAVRTEISTRHALHAAAGAAGAALVLVAGLLALLYRSIAKPLSALSEAARKAAAGDLSQTFEPERRDEIGALAGSFQAMSQSLRSLLGSLRATSEQMAARFRSASGQADQASRRIAETVADQRDAVARVALLVQNMDTLTADVTSNTERLALLAGISSDAASELSGSASAITRQASDYGRAAKGAAEDVGRALRSTRDMFENLELCTASAQEISAVVAELEGAVTDVETKAREATDKTKTVSVRAAQHGTASVRAAVEGMGRIQRCVSSLNGTVNNLGSRSREIGKILGFIDEVARRTSLLSLNAAILAVQAGEHGKSFGVVADEIRGLAEKTTKSTKDIGKVVSGLQADVASSVALAGVGLASVREGIGLVGEVETALDQIRLDSELAAQMSDRILSASADQTEAVRAIADGVRTSTRALESLAAEARVQEEFNRSVLETANAIGGTSDDMVAAVARQIRNTAEISQASAGISKAATEISARASGQRERSAEIVAAVAVTEAGSQELVSQISVLRNSVGSLEGEAERILDELKKFTV